MFLLRFTKKQQWLIFISLLVAFTLILSLLYLKFMMPINQQVQRLEQELENEKKIYEAMASQLKAEKKIGSENSTVQQQLLPVEPLLDQFILDIEKAEIVSDSTISSMSFQVGEAADGKKNHNDQVESDIAKLEARSKQINGAAKGEKAENEKEAIPLPEGVKRLTVNLSVESPDYFALKKFIKTLEDLTRITKIDSLSFSGGNELSNINDSVENPITYSVTVSTFYFPGLDTLQQDVPKIYIPEPSGKINPLPQR